MTKHKYNKPLKVKCSCGREFVWLCAGKKCPTMFDWKTGKIVPNPHYREDFPKCEYPNCIACRGYDPPVWKAENNVHPYIDHCAETGLSKCLGCGKYTCDQCRTYLYADLQCYEQQLRDYCSRCQVSDFSREMYKRNNFDVEREFIRDGNPNVPNLTFHEELIYEHYF